MPLILIKGLFASRVDFNLAGITTRYFISDKTIF
jgi:hypothetical protein